uniref:Uncharacterized protein n=1 Tax=Rhodnius prolixus TaxID=13249 RepID=T1HVW8_RHOPR
MWFKMKKKSKDVEDREESDDEFDDDEEEEEKGRNACERMLDKFKLKSFCYKFSLQMGSVILNTVGLTLMVITMITNFFVPNYTKEYTSLSNYVCISGVRCPDVLWLFDARWRYLGYDCPVYDIYQTWPDYPRKQNLSIPVIEEYWNNLITINMNKSSTNASVLAIIDNTAKDGYMNIMHNITNIN